MEYSSSCVFPTKLVSEYDDVFSFFFFCLKAVLSATRVAKGERIFFGIFFSLQPLFYQPEFALFLCDLIFFSVLDFSLGGQKEQVKLEKTRSQQK